MKKISILICVYLWTIFLCLSISAQDFKTLQDGIEYAEVERKLDKSPVKINLLRLDLTKVRLDVVHAMDSTIGVEKTSSIATRYGAFAAINAGFFRLDSSIFAGDSAGVLMIDNSLYSESYANRVALFIYNGKKKTETNIAHLNISYKVMFQNMYFAAGVNRERKDDDLVVYLPEFNKTTITTENGVEFVVKKNKIKQVLDGKGNNPIPRGGYVISASGKKRDELLKILTKNSKVSIRPVSDSVFSSAPSDFVLLRLPHEDIVGGVPQLIKNGKIEITWEQEKASKSFVETRHPRTAVAKLKDGKFLMVTVDGRSAESVGMNLQELAEFLLELGAVDAMNLDGGGSTTMFLDGKIANKPSDKEGERKVSDAILVFPRRR